MIVTYSERVLVPLVIQNAMGVRHIVMFPAPLYKMLPHYLINGTIFELHSTPLHSTQGITQYRVEFYNWLLAVLTSAAKIY